MPDHSGPSTSFPEGEIDPDTAQERMIAVGERQDPVIAKPRFAAKYDDVAVDEGDATGGICASRSPEEERRG